MFWLYHKLFVLLGFLIIFLESVFGPRMILTTLRKNVAILTISCFLAGVFYVCKGVSPVDFINDLFVMFYIDTLTTDSRIYENHRLDFMMYSLLLPLHTIWRVIRWNMDYLHKFDEMLCHINLFLILIFMGKIEDAPLPLSYYCSAILDILDGLEMTETQLDPTNPVWVQITICLAILMCYIPALLEMYHLKFPEPTTGSFLSKRRVKFIQLVSSVLFFVLRLLLLVQNPRDCFLVAKTIIRVFSHYQTWSNPCRGRKVISVRAAKISAEKASCFANEKLSLAFALV